MNLATTPADQLKPLEHARNHWFPKRANGKAVAPATISRWVLKGVRGVKLDVLRAPGGSVTSEEACQTFLAAVDAAARAEEAEVLDATAAELEEVGL